MLQAGNQLQITQYNINKSGYTTIDNPISNTISEYISKKNNYKLNTTYICSIDEKIIIYDSKTLIKIQEIFITTALEDWFFNYLEGIHLQPITLKIFHQINDNDKIENERLWIKILTQ